MTNFVVITSAILIFAIAVFLAINQRYDDGIIGNAALGGMALASAVPVYEMFAGLDFEFLPTTAILYFSVALFMLRHAYRFVCWSNFRHDWRKNGQ